MNMNKSEEIKSAEAVIEDINEDSPEISKLYLDFLNHLKNKQAEFSHKHRESIGDMLSNKQFLDYASSFFKAGYIAAFNDLKRIGRI